MIFDNNFLKEFYANTPIDSDYHYCIVTIKSGISYAYCCKDLKIELTNRTITFSNRSMVSQFMKSSIEQIFITELLYKYEK